MIATLAYGQKGKRPGAALPSYSYERASMSGTFIAIAIWLGVIVLVSLAVAVAVRTDGEPRRHDGN